MNISVFTSYLQPIWDSKSAKTLSEGADAIATAYHISNIGQTTTIFGAPLINANRDTLKTFIELGLSINLYGGQTQSTISTILSAIEIAIGGDPQKVNTSKDISLNATLGLISGLPPQLGFIGAMILPIVNSIFDDLSIDSSRSEKISNAINALRGILSMVDISNIAYLVMATGICLYWLGSNISPVPPMPPCIAPTAGTRVIFPGAPVPFNANLNDVFRYPQSSLQAITKLYSACVLHQFTIAGFYFGIIPFFPSPIPGPPIPWIGMLNIPFPDIKVPSILDENGDGKVDDDKKSTRSSGSTGTNNMGSTSQTSQTNTSGNPNTGTTTGGTTQTGNNSAGGSTPNSNQSNTSQAGNQGQPTSSNTSSNNNTQSGQSSTSSSSQVTTIAQDSRYSTSGPLWETFNSQLSTVENPYRLKQNLNPTKKIYLQLVLELREQVKVLNNGEDEFQFSITAKLNNIAVDLMLNGSQKNLPVTVGEKINYTYRDTISSNSSIYTGTILSPRLRALELMKEPFKQAIGSVIGEQFNRYINKWYSGKTPVELLEYNFYVTGDISDTSDNILGRNFVPLSKFNELK